MKSILKAFLNKLINISAANKSLFLSRLYHDQFFDIHELDYLFKEPSFYLIEQLISNKKNIFLLDEMDSRDSKVNELSNHLKKIRRQQNLIREESGAEVLFVGWPFVKGKLVDGTPIHCPLLFFPVTLEVEKGKWILNRRTDVDLQLNKSFVLAYSHYNSIAIEDAFIETSFEDYSADSLIFRTSLYEFLKDSPLTINFNQDLFKNVLVKFESFKDSQSLDTLKNGELKLYNTALIGIFPQSNGALIKDYETLIQNQAYHSIEDFLLSKSNQKLAYQPKEENAYFVFPVDGSQERAIATIKEGKSIVVHGPPGTGKSQLICNIVSDFTGRGKRVAVVCRKKVALDVVYERLKSKSLESFVGIVHDAKNDRNRVFDLIQLQIEKLEKYEKENNHLDTVHLERKFIQVSRLIQQIIEELNAFKHALYSTEEYGISAKELYLTTNAAFQYGTFKNYANRFNLENSLAFERKIENYFPYAVKFLNPGYPWINRVSFHSFYQRDLHLIIELIDKIPNYQKQLRESVNRQLGYSSIDFSLDFFIQNGKIAEQILSLIEDEEDYFLILKFIENGIDEPWLDQKQIKIDSIFQQSQPEISLPLNELGSCEQIVHAYLSSRETFITSIYWDLFSGNRNYLKKVFRSNDLPFNTDGALKLLKRIISRKKLEKEKATIDKKNVFSLFPSNFNKEKIKKWFELQRKIEFIRKLIIAQPEIKKILELSNHDFKQFKNSLSIIPLLSNDVQRTYLSWRTYLSAEMISGILHDNIAIENVKEILKKDFELLVEFDRQRQSFFSFELEILDSLFFNLQEGKTKHDIMNQFRNGIRLEWLYQLEEKYPVLKTVSHFKMEELESTLQHSINEKNKLSEEIILLKLKEQCYQNNSYNRLQNRISYRELFHQVSKKKKKWALRKLFSSHFEEITQLVPCWLISPESMSSIFSLDHFFDVVIFDEASQCYSEMGIPAMFRAKQLVIAGDSKQLKPFDLYRSRWENETDELPDLEIDSLLDLTVKYLPSVQLLKHYRSKYLALFDFSNHHFYRDSLSFIPIRSTMDSIYRPIEYLKIDGVWENNSNQIEAAYIVDLITKLVKENPEKSIGVVTFNFKQAELIHEKLERDAIERNWVLPGDIMVKNIENIQGDEKDIIIFSIGYAPNQSGNMSMHFGSLNQEGGENRLNVAVTRAREKIYVVTSILPQQLRVEDAMHEGPKLLKNYLIYAWQVSEGSYVPHIDNAIDHSRDWYLSNKITQWQPANRDIKITRTLPFADLVIQEGTSKNLILTDDQYYYSGISAKEMHAYLFRELQEKGWDFKRFYSRNYWVNPVDFLKEVENSLK